MRRPPPSGVDLVLVPPRVEASLWRRFRFEAELRCRELIFVRYTPLARALATRQLKRRPDYGIELNDMQQFAYEGLLHAIDRFDPLRGTAFGAFARRRILGSMSDGASRMNEIDAQYGYRRRVEAERARSLMGEANADPVRSLAALVTGLAIGLMLEGTSLVEPANGADHRPGPYDSLAFRELLALLAREVSRLPEREARIVRHHYEDGVSFAQIAKLLGISGARASQLHASALARLRARLGRRR